MTKKVDTEAGRAILAQAVFSSAGQAAWQEWASLNCVYLLDEVDQLRRTKDKTDIDTLRNYTHNDDIETGRVVRWDGDLWLLVEDNGEFFIMGLGHGRGGRSVEEEGDPQSVGVTLACLEDVE